MSTFEERLAAVELALQLNQLPASMAVLKRKLEQDWQPDASVLLQPGSITPELLASAINVGNAPIALRFGVGSVSFPVSSFSNVATVDHLLPRAPTYFGVEVTSGHQATYRRVAVSSTQYQFQFQFNDTTGVGPATVTFAWFAIG